MESGLGPAEESDGAAFGIEAAGDGETDAAAAAGYEGVFVEEGAHFDLGLGFGLRKPLEWRLSKDPVYGSGDLSRRGG